MIEQMPKNVNGSAKAAMGRGLVAVFILLATVAMLATRVGADAPACGLEDESTGGQGYPWTDWSCYESGDNCNKVQRQLCDTFPNKWLYREVSSGTTNPCLNVVCGAGSRCEPPQPPGGGG